MTFTDKQIEAAESAIFYVFDDEGFLGDDLGSVSRKAATAALTASDSEWLPIESAPKGYPSLEEPSEWFTAIGKNSGPKGAGFAITRRVFGHGFGPWEGTGDEYYRADFFTHWQPLPTAPIEKE